MKSWRDRGQCRLHFLAVNGSYGERVGAIAQVRRALPELPEVGRERDPVYLHFFDGARPGDVLNRTFQVPARRASLDRQFRVAIRLAINLSISH